MTIILMCALFTAIVKATLPGRLTEGAKGNSIVAVTGITIGLSLYKFSYLFNFNSAWIGFFGIGLIVILAAIIMIHLMKYSSFKPSTSIAATYCVLFLAFALPKPSLFDAFAETLPIMNTIFYGLLVYFLFKLITRSVKTQDNDLKSGMNILSKLKPNPKLKDEIKEEIQDEKSDTKQIEHDEKISDKEIRTINDMVKIIYDIGRLIKSKPELADEDLKTILQKLRILVDDEKTLTVKSRIVKNNLSKYSAHVKKRLEMIEHEMMTSNPLQKKYFIEEKRKHERAENIIKTLSDLPTKAEKHKTDANKILNYLMSIIQNPNKDRLIHYLKICRDHFMNIRKIQSQITKLEKELIGTLKESIKTLKHEEKAFKL